MAGGEQLRDRSIHAAARVGDQGQVFGALLDQATHEQFWGAGAETGQQDARAILDAGHRLGERGHEFVDHAAAFPCVEAVFYSMHPRAIG